MLFIINEAIIERHILLFSNTAVYPSFSQIPGAAYILVYFGKHGK